MVLLHRLLQSHHFNNIAQIGRFVFDSINTTSVPIRKYSLLLPSCFFPFAHNIYVFRLCGAAAAAAAATDDDDCRCALMHTKK